MVVRARADNAGSSVSGLHIVDGQITDPLILDHESSLDHDQEGQVWLTAKYGGDIAFLGVGNTATITDGSALLTDVADGYVNIESNPTRSSITLHTGANTSSSLEHIGTNVLYAQSGEASMRMDISDGYNELKCSGDTLTFIGAADSGLNTFDMTVAPSGLSLHIFDGHTDRNNGFSLEADGRIGMGRKAHSPVGQQPAIGDCSGAGNMVSTMIALLDATRAFGMTLE